MEPVPVIQYPVTIGGSEKNPNLAFSPNTHSPAFLLHNGFGSAQFSDIEMITIQTVSYTSLKDLLPVSPAASIASPTHNSSWHEIPIRNPLVKHAAMAYLQPMSAPPEVGGKGIFGKITDWCCGECGCFAWINDVVWRGLKEAFWECRDEIYDDEDEDKVD